MNNTNTMLPLVHPLAGQSEASRRPRLLVVDDQQLNIQILHKVFAADCQVQAATHGERALALCKENPPDLILLDVVMPDPDGYEVCRRLKADAATRDIPVIFVTAHTDAREEMHGLELGAVDFITKPINPPVVRARVRTHLTLKAQADQLRQMVFIDGMTGVFNRRCFNDRLPAEWGRCAREASPISLLMLDVDFFKRYNDHYGHQAGDTCLIQVAGALKTGLHRPVDLLARYGGEEFAVILPATGLDDALMVGRRLGDLVRQLGLAHERSDAAPFVSISVGVAAAVPEPNSAPEALLALADVQLYRAKQAGRARACGDLLGAMPEPAREAQQIAEDWQPAALRPEPALAAGRA